MDLAAENEELRRRLALGEDAARRIVPTGEPSTAVAEQYRMIVDTIDEGFCVIEIIGSGNGEPLDYRFLQTNASFERQTGLPNAIGRRTGPPTN